MNVTDLPQACISLIENVPGIDFIDEDFAIFDNIDDIPSLDHPMRIDAVVFALCTKGFMRIRINMEGYVVGENHLVLSLPDQIIQHVERSEDVAGIFIVISKNFMEEIIPHIQNTLPAFFYIKEHPVTELNAEEIGCIKEYHSFLWKKVKAKGHPYRKEIAQSLLLAVFHEVYGMFKNHMPIEVKKSRQEELFAAFIQTLALHHKQERSVAFYAGKLCVTPKYLSLLVKNVSSRTAGEWIDNYVVLEAKALLSSSTLSIQEISDRLNFANQSFFGKYFKQHVGISPTEYRKKW